MIKMDILLHAVGMDAPNFKNENVVDAGDMKIYRTWRNRFYTYSDREDMEELYEAGYMMPTEPTKPSCYWYVTPKGLKYIESKTGYKVIVDDE